MMESSSEETDWRSESQSLQDVPPSLTPLRKFGANLSAEAAATRGNVPSAKRLDQVLKNSYKQRTRQAKEPLESASHRLPLSLKDPKVLVIKNTPSIIDPTEVEASDLEYKVTFAPGPIGLHLEPVVKTMGREVGCRVMRFADRGPKIPGQARKSGKIRPGDLVTAIDDTDVISWNYPDVVDRLKWPAPSGRVLTFRSVWQPLFEENTSRKEESVSFSPSSERTDMEDKENMMFCSVLSSTNDLDPQSSVVASTNEVSNSPKPHDKLCPSSEEISCLSPSKVKTILDYQESAPKDSGFRKIVKHVTPAYSLTSNVTSAVSTKLGEVLVGHSSSEFDEAVKLKMGLLDELSRAKAKLDAFSTDKERCAREEMDAKLISETKWKEMAVKLAADKEKEFERIMHELGNERQLVQQLQSTEQDMSQRLQSKERENDKLRNQLEQERRSHARKDTEHPPKAQLELEQELASSRAHMNRLASDLEKVRVQLSTNSMELDTQSSALDSLKDERDCCLKEIDKYCVRERNMKSRIEALELECESLRRDLSDAKKNASVVEEEKNGDEKLSVGPRCKNEEYEEEIIILRQELKEKDDGLRVSMQMVDGLKAESDALKTEIGEKTRLLISKDSELENARQLATELESQIAKEFSSTNTAIKAVRRNGDDGVLCEHLKERLEEKDEELIRLEEKLKKSNTRVAELTESLARSKNFYEEKIGNLEIFDKEASAFFLREKDRVILSLEKQIVDLSREKDEAIRKRDDCIEQLQNICDSTEDVDGTASLEYDGIGCTGALVSSPVTFQRWMELSKTELGMKCCHLENALSKSDFHLREARTEAVQHYRRVKSLESDLEAMSREVNLLVNTNKKIEEKLREAKSAQKTLDDHIGVLNADLLNQQNAASRMQTQLDICSRSKARDDLEILELTRKLKENEGASESIVRELKQTIINIETERNVALTNLGDKSKELSGLQRDLSTRESELASLREVVSDLESNLEVLRGEALKSRNDFELQVSSLHDEAEAKAEALASSQGCVKELKQTILSLEDQLESNLKAAREESRRLPVVELQLRNAENEVNEARARILEQMESIKQLEERSKWSLDTEKHLGEEIADLQHAVAALELSLEQQQQENEEMKKRRRVYESEISDMKAASKERESRYDAYTKSLRESLRDAEERCDSAVTDAEKKAGEALLLQRDLKQCESDMVSLRNEITVRDNEIAALHDQQEVSRKQFEAQIGGLRDQVSTLEDQLTSSQTQVGASKRKIDGLVENLSTCEDKLRSITQEATKSNQKLTEAQSESEYAKSELENALKLIAEQKASIQAIQNVSQQSKRDADSLNEQIGALKEVVSELQGSLLAKSSSHESVEARNAMLQREVDEARTVTEKALEENRLLKCEYQRSLQQEGESRELLSSQVVASKSMEHDLRERDNHIDHLKAHVQILQSTISRIRSENLMREQAEDIDRVSKVAQSRRQSDDDKVGAAHSAMKSASARIVCQILESRRKASVGRAFRHWACATSATLAMAYQMTVAEAMAQQLQATRKKLVVLKSHMRQAREDGVKPQSHGFDSPTETNNE